jgi:hypothetical protein
MAKKQKSNCTVGASCKSTCIARNKDCQVTTNNPAVAVATTKLKGDLKEWPKGVKSIAWGRMQLFTSGHEKLMKASDLTLLSKASDKHINKLSELFPGNKFGTTEKGIFNYLSEYKKPIPNLVLGEDNKALGDNILKYGLAKKVTYIPRPPGSVSSTEARALFRGGATPEDMVKRGFFSSEEQAIYGQKIALDLI